MRKFILTMVAMFIMACSVNAQSTASADSLHNKLEELKAAFEWRDSLVAANKAKEAKAAQAAQKKKAVQQQQQQVTSLEMMNMIVPGLFSKREIEAWKKMPKQQRQAIMNAATGGGSSTTNWDMLNDAQKAFVHEQSNGK